MMKKKQFLSSLCAALFLVACGTKVPDNEFRIEGTLTGVPDSTVISLFQENGDLLEIMQSDTVAGGRFLFADTLSAPCKLFLLCVAPGFPSNFLELWVAPGERVRVTGHDKLIHLWDVQSRLPEQAELNRFAGCTRDLMRQQAVCDLQRDSLMQVLMKRQQAGTLDPATLQQLKNQSDSLQQLYFQWEYQIARKVVDCLRTAPYSATWLDELESQAKMVQNASTDDLFKDFQSLEQPLKELYAALPDSVKQSPAGRRICNQLYPPRVVGVGDTMADGPLYDAEGREHRLAEFSGKYILLDFWSQGCGPCVQSIPELEKVSAAYAGRLAVVSISSDPVGLWKRFLQDRGLKGYQWNELRNDGGGLAAAYNVRGIPHYVLIAPDGRVQDVWTGYGEGSLERKLKENLE